MSWQRTYFIALGVAAGCAALVSAQPVEVPPPGSISQVKLIERLGSGPKQGLDSRVSVNIREWDLAQAVRVLGEEAGFSVILGKDVVGKVSCYLTEVPARIALEALLRANGYDYVQTNGVLIVVKQGQQREIEKSPAAATRKVVRRTFRLPYTGTETDSTVAGTGAVGAAGAGKEKGGKALDLVIKEMLSPSGRLSFYERQHVLVVEDDESVINAIDEFVKQLWAVPAQVFIDSKLLEVSLEEGENYGLRWTTQTKVGSSGKRDQFSGEVETRGTLVNSSAPSLGLDRFFSFGVVNSNIEVVLEALGTRRRVDLRSNPRVLVMNHRTATIVVGQEIPYLSSEESTTANPIRTYAFKEVAVRLEVTPHVSDNSVIFLDVHPIVKSVIGYTDEPRQPILSTREAATNVAVHDGSTLIIGGLVQRNVTRAWTETPFIARIPLIGLLFRQKSHTDTKNDLLFLLCPRVVTPELMQQELKASPTVATEPPEHPGTSTAAEPKW